MLPKSKYTSSSSIAFNASSKYLGLKPISSSFPSVSTGTYFINFVDENGNVKKCNFNKMTCSKKAGVLESELLNILEEYGQSINENEKRQVLINILEELSK